MFTSLVQKKKYDAADSHQRAPGEAPSWPVPKQCPAHQARGNEEKREDRRHNPGCDMAFGEVDRVEIDAECVNPRKSGGEKALAADVQALAAPAPRPFAMATAAMTKR